MSEGKEGNDDNLRSLQDLFKAFGDSEERFRDRVERGDDDEEEETEESEEERREREERERIAALNAAGVSHVLGTGERQKKIVKELLREEKLKNSEDEEDEEDE